MTYTTKETQQFTYLEYKKLEELFAWAKFYRDLPNWNNSKERNIEVVQAQIEELRKKLFNN